MSALGRFLRRPVGWPHLAVVLLTCLVMLESESVPAGRFGGTVGGMMVLLACGVVWLLRLVIATVLRWRTPPAERGPLAWRPWLYAPVVVVATGVLLLTQAPLRLRFAASRGALDRFAETVMRESRETPGAPLRARHQPTSVGLFEVTDVERTPHGMRFIVPGTGFLDRGGFAYEHEGTGRDDGPGRTEPLDGPWFVYIDDSF